ncbi:MmcQ/YjbR family DNA-binding protein [Paenibacillus sp. RC67]|uniref:MmcQ/YjbR family DNA-binding protein n=1 Tax=Paenibacillus sp. RC67 TaxID=3039392 RepID=UPI0024ACA583|nr:MmcQ/YjbR family DNA-binding protein [Paenibacillus sp. RC67]
MTYHKPITSKEGLELVEKIRKHCSQFPEVTENVDSFGHTSFRISDKPFVMLGEKETVSLSIKADKHTQEFLLQQEDTNYVKTPYIGHHGWVTVLDLDRADWKEIEELIIEGYFRTAPKKYVNMLKRAEHR